MVQTSGTLPDEVREHLPQQVAELRKDVNEAMHSLSALYQDMELRFLRAGNRPHQLDGTKRPKEGEDGPSRNAPENGKARQTATCPSKGLSGSGTEAFSISLSSSS